MDCLAADGNHAISCCARELAGYSARGEPARRQTALRSSHGCHAAKLHQQAGPADKLCANAAGGLSWAPNPFVLLAGRGSTPVQMQLSCKCTKAHLVDLSHSQSMAACTPLVNCVHMSSRAVGAATCPQLSSGAKVASPISGVFRARDCTTLRRQHMHTLIALAQQSCCGSKTGHSGFSQGSKAVFWDALSMPPITWKPYWFVALSRTQRRGQSPCQGSMSLHTKLSQHGSQANLSAPWMRPRTLARLAAAAGATRRAHAWAAIAKLTWLLYG